MEKIIKIYVSSRNALKEERKQIEEFICTLSNLFEKNYNVRLQILSCEENEDYREKIRNCDFCVFLCSEENQKFIEEELEFSRSVFEENYFSKIYFFFKKTDKESTESSELLELEDYLTVISCYYSMFESVDVIKFRILCALKFGFMDYIDIESRKEKCFVDGHEILDIDNLPEVKNNNFFMGLKRSLEKTQKECKEISRELRENGIIPGKVAEQKNLLKQTYKGTITRLRCKIITASINLGKNKAQGKMTQRQMMAYQCFEGGDYKSALRWVDAKNTQKGFLYDRTHFPDMPGLFENHLNTILTYIDIAIANDPYEKNDSGIDELFDDLVNLTYQTPKGIDFLSRYMEWQIDSKLYKKATDAFEKFCSTPFWKGISSNEKAKLFNIAADAYQKDEKNKKAEMLLVRQMLIYNDLKNESVAYMSSFAKSFYYLGNFYSSSDTAKAVEHYKAAVELYETLCEKNPERFIPFIAITLFRLGVASDDEAYFVQALNMAKKYPEHPASIIVIGLIAFRE